MAQFLIFFQYFSICLLKLTFIQKICPKPSQKKSKMVPKAGRNRDKKRLKQKGEHLILAMAKTTFVRFREAPKSF